ncbi:hypothetical protein ABPG74_011422 [Tetrahymena malaccensis]
MDSFHKNFIYQVNREENEDQQSLNTQQLAQQLTKTLQSEHDQQSSVENESNSYFRERMQHPFIIRINNQQQNQNQGDQSNSLKNFPSLLQVSQQKIRRKKSSEISKGDHHISIYYESQQGGNTTDSFIQNQSNNSDFKYKTDCNQNDNEESKTSYVSKIQDNSQQITNLKRQKSFSIQKFNILQANQFDFKRKKKFSLDNCQNEQKNRTKTDQFQGNNLIDDQKSFKKRNNLLFMDYQTQKYIWRTKWIQITSLISKMKKIAHYSSLFFRPNELSDLQIKLIDDVSSNQVSLKFSSFSKYKLGSLLSYENLQNIISFKNYRKMELYHCFIFQGKSYILGTYLLACGITQDFCSCKKIKGGWCFTNLKMNPYLAGNILYDFKQKKDLYLQELAKINKYFKQNNVELGLQCRARKYIQYLYSDESNDNISSIKSLSNLSEYLQKEIQTDVYIKKLKKIKLFSEIFTDEILVELSLQMKEAFYCHDQIISQSDEENDYYLNFVNNGIILEYCQHQQNTVVKEIQEYRQGQYFGLLAFLQGDNRRRVKYKSVGVSSILRISYNSFVNVLKEHNLAYQEFCFIRDEVKFSNKLMKINAYCNSCQQQNHVLEECPYLFYEGKKQVILRNYFRKQDNIFKNFRRQSTTKSQNALLNLNRVSSQADRYYISNIEFFSMWDFTDDSGYESNEDFQNLSKQNSSKKFIERQKSNQEGYIEKNISQVPNRESIFYPEQHKEISAQNLSEKKIIIPESEKNNNSSKYIERFSGEIPSEQLGRYLSLIKKMDTLYRSQSHNYNSCQIQNCVYCNKQIELIYNLFEKNSIKQERNSKLNYPFKNFAVENKHKKSSIFCHKDKNETEFNQLSKQLSLNQPKDQKQNSFIDIHQKISEIEKLLKKNSFKQSITTYSQDQLFYYDFDLPASFINYYPLGNFENIVKYINSIIQSKNQ